MLGLKAGCACAIMSLICGNFLSLLAAGESLLALDRGSSQLDLLGPPLLFELMKGTRAANDAILGRSRISHLEIMAKGLAYIVVIKVSCAVIVCLGQ